MSPYRSIMVDAPKTRNHLKIKVFVGDKQICEKVWSDYVEDNEVVQSAASQMHEVLHGWHDQGYLWVGGPEKSRIVPWHKITDIQVEEYQA